MQIVQQRVPLVCQNCGCYDLGSMWPLHPQERCPIGLVQVQDAALDPSKSSPKSSICCHIVSTSPPFWAMGALGSIPPLGGSGSGVDGSVQSPDGLRRASHNLSPRHHPGSNDVFGSPWALPIARGRPWLWSQTWWWWLSPPSEMVDLCFVVRQLDLAIRHLVPIGEAWLSLKTKPNIGHGGRC
jgi:hypothetical protein